MKNPYKVGWYVDGKKIVHTEKDIYAYGTYYWCKLEDGTYRDTSRDDVPIERQNITKV